MKSDLADYTVVLLHETEAAIKVTDDGSREMWLPKSKIEFHDTGDRDHRLRPVLEVTVPGWLAKEKGLS